MKYQALFIEKKKQQQQTTECCLPEFEWCYNIFPTNGDFCRLLITLANSLDLDQAWQNAKS